MPKTIVNDEGNEESVFTAEEVRALEEEKEKALQDANSSLEEAKKKLEETEAEMSKLKEKDTNFANLRSMKEDAEKKKEEAELKIESLKKEFEEKLEVTKKEMQENGLKQYYDSMLEALVGNDEEAKKKVEEQYGRLSDPVTDRASIEKKLKDAWALSQDRSDLTGNAFASLGSAPLKPAANKKWSDEEKELAQKLASAGGMKLEETDFN